MASEGDRLAKAVQVAVKNLNRYISATQLGITLTSLGLGWIGEPALAGLMDRALGVFGIRPPAAAVHTVAGATTAFIVITFLHIVLGELTPKAIAPWLRKAGPCRSPLASSATVLGLMRLTFIEFHNS